MVAVIDRNGNIVTSIRSCPIQIRHLKTDPVRRSLDRQYSVIQEFLPRLEMLPMVFDIPDGDLLPNKELVFG